MSDGIGLSELARRLGRAKSGLHKLASLGQIPRNTDGSFDQVAVEKALGNLDPARRRPVHPTVHERTVNSERVNTPLDCLASFDDPAHRGAAYMGLRLFYELPASAANLAIAAGASARTAFGLRRLMAVSTMLALEDALAEMGADTKPLSYFPDSLDDLDWPAKCREAGETYDPEGWAAWLGELNRKLETA